MNDGVIWLAGVAVFLILLLNDPLTRINWWRKRDSKRDRRQHRP
jgi:hypothetical protein